MAVALTPPPDINRKPEDMDTPELINAYQHASVLAELNLSAPLAKALSGWMFTVRRVLEKRGQYDESCLRIQEGRATLWYMCGSTYQKHASRRT
jgi:hypothetical protein